MRLVDGLSLLDNDSGKPKEGDRVPTSDALSFANELRSSTGGDTRRFHRWGADD